MLIICLERKIWNSVNFKLRILQKDVREPHISNGFREAFRVLLRILARLAGRLITQLSHFPTLFGSLFFDINNRVTRVTFFSTSTIELKSKNSTRWQQSCHLVEFLVFNSAFDRYRRWLRLRRISTGRPRRIIIWYPKSSWDFILFRGWNGGKNLDFSHLFIKSS